jgi:hypothetical protein
MATIGDWIFDNGLGELNTTTGTADKLTITSTEATTYTEANATLALGHDNGNLSITGPADRAGGGREVTAGAISGGTVTGTGTAGYYAIIDTVNSRLLVTGALSASQGVTTGNTFSLTSFKVGIPDPA